MLTLILISQEVKSQTPNCNFSLSGKIIDEHDQTPLSFSTIYIKELEKGIISDEDGSFQLKNLCEGKYTLLIGHIGCEPDTQVVFLKKDIKKIF